MPELRYDALRGGWILLAEGRRARPIGVKSVEQSDVDCPFCQGREDQTPREVWAYRKSGNPNEPGWLVRVVPNKYPALVPNQGELEEDDGAWLRKRGYGYHEVILESPDHHKDLSDHSIQHLSIILLAYRERMKALYSKKGIRYVQIFRNWGPLGGASLPHPHTQVLALPQIPEIPERELLNLRKEALLCNIFKTEEKNGVRFLTGTRRFSAITPFASRFAYEILLAPKNHEPDFREISGEAIRELAGILSRVLEALKKVLGAASYNIILHSIADPYFHWHIEITPRIAGWAGFELGTGYFINTVSPEEAALDLRKSL